MRKEGRRVIYGDGSYIDIIVYSFQSVDLGDSSLDVNVLFL